MITLAFLAGIEKTTLVVNSAEVVEVETALGDATAVPRDDLEEVYNALV